MGFFGWGKKSVAGVGGNILPLCYAAPLSVDHVEVDPNTPTRVIEGNRVVTLSGTGGLTVHLMEQSEQGAARVLNFRRLEELGLSPDGALSLAISNLQREVLPRTSLKVRVESGVEQFRYVEGAGDYTASLILTEQFWKDYSIDSNAVAVVVPHRRVLAFAIDRGREGVEALRGVNRLYFDDPEENPKFLLLDAVLVRKPGCDTSWSPVSTLN